MTTSATMVSEIPRPAIRRRRVRASPPDAVSERKRAANRANARKSTGPRTTAGKMRVACNALRHGLNRPVTADPALAGDIDAWVRVLCGLAVGAAIDAEAAEPALQLQLQLARRIAEAQIEIARIKRVSHDLTMRAFADPDYRPRRHRRARNRQMSGADGMPSQHNPPSADLEYALRLHPQGPVRQALIFGDIYRELAAMDRYLARAVKRRDLAMLEFAKARAQAQAALDAAVAAARSETSQRSASRAILRNKATDAHIGASAVVAKPTIGPARGSLQDAARRIRALLGFGTGPPAGKGLLVVRRMPQCGHAVGVRSGIYM
jgi:hypothetical protein